MFRNKPIACTCLAILVFAIGGFNAFLRSHNEISSNQKAQGVRTKVGDYASFEPMGMLPVSLIFALETWPNSSSCLSDPAKKMIRWSDLKSDADIKVCLSRVLNDGQSDEDVKAVLLANGFKGDFVPFALKDRTQISASCMESNTPCGSAVGSFRWLFLRPYGFAIVISRKEQKTLDVSVQKLSL